MSERAHNVVTAREAMNQLLGEKGRKALLRMAHRAGRRSARLVAEREVLANTPTPAVVALLEEFEKLSGPEADQFAAVLMSRSSSFAGRVFRAATRGQIGGSEREVSDLLLGIVRKWRAEVKKRDRKPTCRERDAEIVRLHERDRLSFGQIAKKLGMRKDAAAKAYQREKARAEPGTA